jgi:hypothetical protein
MDEDLNEKFQEGMYKLCDYSNDVAKRVGVTIDAIILDSGRSVGCLDHHLVDITSKNHIVSVKLFHNEIEDFPGHAGLDLTQAKINNALERLKLLLQD